VTALTDGRVPPFGHPRITARLTAPRGLSRPTTSFIGSWCQGIHRAPLKTWPQRCSHPLFRSQTPTGSPPDHRNHQPPARTPTPPKGTQNTNSAVWTPSGNPATPGPPPEPCQGLRSEHRAEKRQPAQPVREDEEGRGCVLRTQQRVIRYDIPRDARRAPDPKDRSDCDVPPMSAGTTTNGWSTGQPCDPGDR
jgi:hypothetical protein